MMKGIRIFLVTSLGEHPAWGAIDWWGFSFLSFSMVNLYTLPHVSLAFVLLSRMASIASPRGVFRISSLQLLITSSEKQVPTKSDGSSEISASWSLSGRRCRPVFALSLCK